MQAFGKARDWAWQLVSALLLAVPLGHAGELKEFDLVAASVPDDRAVVRRAGTAELILLKTGDAVPGTDAVVRQILADRVLIDVPPAADDKNKSLKPHFLFRAQPNVRSRLEPVLSEAEAATRELQVVPGLPASAKLPAKLPVKTAKPKKKNPKSATPASKKLSPTKQ